MSNQTPKEVFYFQEKLEVDDPISSDYKSKFFSKRTPIIIDNGSYHCRAGWGGEEEPRLNFRCMVGKARPRHGETTKEIRPDLLVGNDLKQSDFARMATRTPFDENIVYHYDAQENILDHIFSRLGINTEKVEHPILMSEAVCNPNYCRKNMSELLFECYNVPSVCYGVDSLFSFYYNRIYDQPDFPSYDGLILSSGYTSTHILPILSSTLHINQAKRISLGGFHCTDYMQKLMQIKYPLHRNAITLDRAQQLKEKHCYIAPNYIEELNRFGASHEQEEKKGEEDNYGKARVIQLPFVAAVAAPVLSEEEKQRKQQQKVEQGMRLKQFAENRRKEKLEEKELQLTILIQLQECKDSNPIAYQNGLKEQEINSDSALIKQIAKLTAEVQKAREGSDETAEKKDKPKKKSAEDEKFEQNPEEFINNLKKRKQDLEERRDKRQRMNSQSTSRRNTVAKQRRMRAITNIAFDQTNAPDDSFGMNDDDWNIYLTAANEPHPDNEEEAAELLQVEQLLSKYDKNSAALTTGSQSSSGASDYPQEIDYQLYLNVERIRVPEILFQPSIIGVEQMGLTEAIYHVLNQFSKNEQEAIMKQVFISGGNTKYPLMSERMKRDLQCIRPVASVINVFKANDPILDAWRGASKWSTRSYTTNKMADFTSSCITRKAYEEKGSDYLVEHYLSNIYLS